MYSIVYFLDEKTGISYFVSDFSSCFDRIHLKIDTNPQNACFILKSGLVKVLNHLPSCYVPIVLDLESWNLIKNSLKNN